jgi:hypothetical protein
MTVTVTLPSGTVLELSEGTVLAQLQARPVAVAREKSGGLDAIGWVVAVFAGFLFSADPIVPKARADGDPESSNRAGCGPEPPLLEQWKQRPQHQDAGEVLERTDPCEHDRSLPRRTLPGLVSG